MSAKQFVNSVYMHTVLVGVFFFCYNVTSMNGPIYNHALNMLCNEMCRNHTTLNLTYDSQI